MNSRKKNAALVMTGVLVGTMLTGPAVHAAEEYFKAYRSNQAIYLDGQQIQLEAYTIDGSNYVKLRDIGAALDFNVYWDGAVRIDCSAPYTGTAPAQPQPEAPTAPREYTIHTDHWSREDFSQQANPAVFTGACGAYARAFKVLCGEAGIPCFSISTDIHTWNMVYADGEWLHVDVSLNDFPAGNVLLLERTALSRVDVAPEATEFLKEFLVPGSTR